MATILIEKISVTTKNGTNAEITGIDITDTDCLHGNVKGTNVRWDENGTCRDKIDAFNIDAKENEVSEALNTVKKLQGEV